LEREAEVLVECLQVDDLAEVADDLVVLVEEVLVEEEQEEGDKSLALAVYSYMVAIYFICRL